MTPSHHSAKMIEDMIAEYLSSVDVSDNFSVKSMKTDLKRMLGEEPAIKINWISETPIFEAGKKNTSKIDKVKSITVSFTHGEDENNNPLIHTIEILK